MTNKVNGGPESVEILTRLVAIYKTALGTARQKQKVLGVGTIVELKEVVKAEKVLAEQIEELERERLEIQTTYGLPGTFSELIGLLPEERKTQAAEAAHELSQLVRELIIQNNINNEIIAHLQNFMNSNLDLIHDLRPSSTYGYGGDVPPPPSAGRSIVDRKI